MSQAEETVQAESNWFRPPAWGFRDLIALAAWTAGLCWVFRDAVFLKGAFFYFDVTEINYPYRYFFAEELKAGRFSRWCPWLYCGMPLFSESQAGYLHPLKYLFYPWMETWKAFNFDTVLSIWLAGAGTYGWLRRHVGPAGALTGAALFGAGGFTWAHLIHTSMINALASVPFVVWSLEWSWGRGGRRGVALGGFALACQVFAGHLQDVILCSGIVGFYGLYRASTSTTRAEARTVLSRTFGLVAMGVLLSAVQWSPSKELLDRSPRAGGLTYDELTYGSWSPELLPTIALREAYGTRARDTDWMDGFYPYHEMDAYLGLLGLALAIVGATGPPGRDRWTTGFVLLTIAGMLLMLGRFTFLFDYANKIPVAGSSRVPVRLHLWVSLGVAALAAAGVERLQRPGAVSLRAATIFVAAIVFASLPILAYVYAPVWTEPRRWTMPYHVDRYRWLGREMTVGAARTAAIVIAGLMLARAAVRSADGVRRGRLAAFLPVLVLFDLLAAHEVDPTTVDPSYWTSPPESVQKLKAAPGFVRVFGTGDRSAGEPGYASESIDFFRARDALDWSLPAAWGLSSAKGATPMISKRLIDFFDNAESRTGHFDLDAVTHILTGKASRSDVPVGEAFFHANPNAMPRARLAGRPVYAADAKEALATLKSLGTEARQRLVVEDPTRPLPAEADPKGEAKIEIDLPELVVVSTSSDSPAYLVLADTFDPGWSATVDGRPAPIVPAYAAFRAVHLGPGPHRVEFRYSPAGFATGLMLTTVGLALAMACFIRPEGDATATDHGAMRSAGRMKGLAIAAAVIIVAASIPRVGPQGLGLQSRWQRAVHTFTWGAGLEAMHENRR